MFDKNGHEIKTGDIVEITGAYFKNATVRNSAFKSCAKTRLGPKLSVSARNQRRSSANEIPYC